jgi:hypothetical protein
MAGDRLPLPDHHHARADPATVMTPPCAGAFPVAPPAPSFKLDPEGNPGPFFSIDINMLFAIIPGILGSFRKKTIGHRSPPPGHHALRADRS